MYLQEIFDYLITGELSVANFGLTGDGTLNEAEHKALINHINVGLTALHKRFNLKTAELMLQQYDEVEHYHLIPAYATSNLDSSEPIKYIVDDGPDTEPFYGGVLAILNVIDEEKCEVRLNDSNYELSAFTPRPDVLQIPYPDKDKTWSVIYKANHALIPLDANPATEYIELTEAYLEPLLLFVAHRHYVGRPLGESGANESTQFKQLYELACKRIKDAGLESFTNSSSDQLEINGWV